jgi:hypothetical protein
MIRSAFWWGRNVRLGVGDLRFLAEEKRGMSGWLRMERKVSFSVNIKVDYSRFLPEIITRFKAVLLHYSLSNLNLNGVFQNWEK